MGMYEKPKPSSRRRRLDRFRRPALLLVLGLAALPFLAPLLDAAVQTGIGWYYEVQVEEALILGDGSYADVARITTLYSENGGPDYSYMEIGNGGLEFYGGVWWDFPRSEASTDSIIHWYPAVGTLVFGGNAGGPEAGGITTFFWGSFSATSAAEDPMSGTVAFYQGRIIHRAAYARCAGGDDPGQACVIDGDCPGVGGTCTTAADASYQIQNGGDGTDPIFEIHGDGGFDFYSTNCGAPGSCTADTELGRLGADLWGGENGTELVSDGCVYVNGTSGRTWCSGSGAPAGCSSSAERGNLYTNTADSSSTLYVCQGDGAGGESWTAK